MTEKQSIAHWNKFVKEILESTDIDEHEGDAEKMLRREQLENEPESWFNPDCRPLVNAMLKRSVLA